MKEKETLQSIGNGVHIFTSPAYPFGTDAILLADFAAPKRADIACDLGTGCGIIPLLWARYDSPCHITALDIQPEAVALLQKSIAAGALEARIEAVCGDVRFIEETEISSEAFSLITMNPPYFAMGSGFRNSAQSRETARHEISGTTEDFLRCAAKLLRYGGRLCLCQKPERLTDILCAMRANGLEPKRLRFVAGKAGKAPFLLLVEGKKGGAAGIQVLPELAVQNEDGSWSREMIEIYKDYGDGTKQ